MWAEAEPVSTGILLRHRRERKRRKHRATGTLPGRSSWGGRFSPLDERGTHEAGAQRDPEGDHTHSSLATALDRGALRPRRHRLPMGRPVTQDRRDPRTRRRQWVHRRLRPHWPLNTSAPGPAWATTPGPPLFRCGMSKGQGRQGDSQHGLVLLYEEARDLRPTPSHPMCSFQAPLPPA